MSVNKKGITLLYEAESPAIEYVEAPTAIPPPFIPLLTAFAKTIANNSIVFVHGFTGDPQLTWTLKNAKHCVAGNQGLILQPSEPGGSASEPSTPSTPPTTRHNRTSYFTNNNSDHQKRSSKLPHFGTGRRSTPTTAPRCDVFWPRDLLPRTVSNARVLTYGYDTKIRHAFVGPVSKNNVVDHGWDLLCALEDVRRDNPSRPLLFMAHSLGGLIAKIALIKSQDFEHVKPHLHYVVASTVGVFFFGTPHRGADPLGPGIRQILMAMAKGFAFKLNNSIVGTLMPSGEYLREIRDSFLSLAKQRNLVIYSFQEEYGVNRLAGRKVVDDESSRLDEPTIETHRHISNNHMDMVRFTGLEDNEYRKVASAISLVIHNLTSARPVTEDSGGDTAFPLGQDSDLAVDADYFVPPEQSAMREKLMDLLYFNEIDARLMSLKSAYSKTCQWVLEKHEYREWVSPEKINDHHGFLWIKGKPGAGKSILMKFLDNNARKTATAHRKLAVVSFFFNARGEELERTTLGLYRSLLWQLLQEHDEIQAVLDLLETNTRGFILRRGWQTELLKQTMTKAIAHFKGDRELCLFIDALDECSDDETSDMVAFFEELGERAAEQNINLRICFSSRYYPTIYVKKGIEIKLDEEEEHGLDIGRYIDSHLKLGTLESTKKADALRKEILEKSAGIFLWVALA
ncbi:hypothetical protein VMCG_03419 [Cytospora schulzeri]|uniref:Nephrocystin 3-like N-terminal domain-containing protein n=1 Tax=Cytospora schulzeri TaxID=448051 RepID=A0A423WWV3_9PEZI|nr:hypothetical protein VMCG_03419 [Valsa malicola]